MAPKKVIIVVAVIGVEKVFISICRFVNTIRLNTCVLHKKWKKGQADFLAYCGGMCASIHLHTHMQAHKRACAHTDTHTYTHTHARARANKK